MSHFNVAATHSPKVLRQLAGYADGPNKNARGAALSGALQGVDVAGYQHPGGVGINWRRAARAGIQFAAVKATEGAYYRNPFALTDLAQARAAGLSVMAYAFAIPNGNGGSGSPVAQADYLIRYLSSANGPLPPVMLDIEYNPYGAECYGLSQPAMRSWIAQFSAEVQAKTGAEPIIYGPGPWWHDCTGSTSRFAQFPLWVPDYTSAPRPLITPGWSNYSFWQYSSAGSVAGINAAGDTDLDQMNPAAIPLLNPGRQLSVAGSTVNLQAALADPVKGQALSFSAAGLPPGTSISPSGQITGWPVAVGSYSPMVSATNSKGQSGSVSFSWNVSSAPSAGPTGQVQLDLGGECLTAGSGTQPTPAPSGTPPASTAPTPPPASSGPAGNTPATPGGSGTQAVISACTGNSAQSWTYAQDGTLRINNECLTIPTAAQGAPAGLEQCASSPAQQWHLVYPRGLNPARGARPTTLLNPWSGMCLADPGFSTSNGTGVVLWPCNGYTNQSWTLPAGPVTSQIPGLCLDDSGDQTANLTKIDIALCDGSAGQAWLAEPDGTVRINGKCLDVGGGARSTGSPVDLYSCNGTGAQQWHLVTAGGGVSLVNPASGLCLSDPGDATAEGTQAVIASCAASDPGMSWQVS